MSQIDLILYLPLLSWFVMLFLFFYFMSYILVIFFSWTMFKISFKYCYSLSIFLQMGLFSVYFYIFLFKKWM